MPKRRRITIEYTLIRGVNDAPDDADRMVALLRNVPVKVNLIPMNPVPETPLAAPDLEAVRAFQQRLFGRGLSAFVRKQRGEDIDAACGQLALHGAEARRKRTLPTVASS
jgi:23S rRNA (adenine2503-C2)-methyltransferase